MVSVMAGLVWWTGGFAAARETPAVAERFLSRVEMPLRSYAGRRIMRARNDRFRKEGWLEAAVTFRDSDGLTYRIIASGGSDYVLRRVLEPALAGEADLWRRGEAQRFGLTEANYAFAGAPDDEESDGEAHISVTPRRKHHLLVLGTLHLSPDGDLLRVEGRLSRNPSFWTSRVDIVRTYRRIRDLRVPVELQTTAHVRIAGPSQMQVQYLYSAINGLPVGPEATEVAEVAEK